MERIEKGNMDVLTALTTRRSIRRYTQAPVTEAELNTVLNAGFCAPTTKNLRPWDFIVVRDRAILADIAENNRYMKMLPAAGLAIVVCGREAVLAEHDLLVNDCSAATENILLAAHGIGLGAVWCGVPPQRTAYLRERLSIPADVLPAAVISVGHPDERREAPERFDTSRVHLNGYQTV